MIRSMTAFGRCEYTFEQGVIIWELRSVNHRYLDLSLRLMDDLREIEPAVRAVMAGHVKRGKLELNLRYKPVSTKNASMVVNHELAALLTQACSDISSSDFSDYHPVNPMDVLRWPGVVSSQSIDYKPVVVAALSALNEAIIDFTESREREGEKIAQMLLTRTQQITDIVTEIRVLRPAAVQRIMTKWRTRLDALDVATDTDRLEQELVIAAQKLDIDEELDRLDAHVSELAHTLARDEAIGRRLDFLIQEFNREANTISSKSGDTQITKLSIDLKVLIEQMREQVQNVE